MGRDGEWYRYNVCLYYIIFICVHSYFSIHFLYCLFVCVCVWAWDMLERSVNWIFFKFKKCGEYLCRILIATKSNFAKPRSNYFHCVVGNPSEVKTLRIPIPVFFFSFSTMSRSLFFKFWMLHWNFQLTSMLMKYVSLERMWNVSTWRSKL